MNRRTMHQSRTALIPNVQGYSKMLRIYSDKAVYTSYEDPARYLERVITKAELSSFRDFITQNQLEDRGPQTGFCHHNCAVTEFFAVRRARGRRVFSHQAADDWLSVLTNFDLLGRGENAKTRYVLEKEIDGLEVLYAGDLSVRDVWQKGAEIRILVERESTPEELAARNKLDESDDDEDLEVARARKRARQRADQRARISWRPLENGKVGKAVATPEGHVTFAEATFDFDNDDFPSHLNQHLGEAFSGDFIILAGSDGLWRQQAGLKPMRITGEDTYANPIVTADGRWVVAAKTDSHWADPNYIVRLNLQTGREFRVNVPPADNFGTIAYLPNHEKILLRRAKDNDVSSPNKSVGPERPEYYLLDPASGQAVRVTGVFAPLEEEGKRFLQSTGKPDEYWAAISDSARDQTQVGRYNLRDFSFRMVFVVPKILFDSRSMWVDESGTKLYLVYEGQLMRLPLPKTQ